MEDCKGGNPWTATGGRETSVVSRLDRDWRKQNPEYESRKVNFFGGNVMSASRDKWIQSETPRASSSRKGDRKSSKNRFCFCTTDNDERGRKGEKQDVPWPADVPWGLQDLLRCLILNGYSLVFYQMISKQWPLFQLLVLIFVLSMYFLLCLREDDLNI